MNIIKSVFVGTGIGVFVAFVSEFFSDDDTEDTIIEVKEEETVTENTMQETVNQVDDAAILNKEAKKRTLQETLRVYGIENNKEMVTKVKETIDYFKAEGIYKEPSLLETSHSSTIDELCGIVSKLNNQIKANYTKSMDELNSKILCKSTRKITFYVNLPTDLQTEERGNNHAFSRTLRLSHIKTVRDRMDRIAKRYSKNSVKILEKDYFVLLYNLTQMYKELKSLEIILPSTENVYPSVNVIADTVFTPNNRTEYFSYLEQTLSEEEFRFCRRYKKELEYNDD